MKLVKTSAIAVAMSALLSGPVLAQGASSDTPIRGGAKGTTQMQDDMPAAASHKAGAKPGTKGTVGAASGAPKTTGAPATPPASAR